MIGDRYRPILRHIEPVARPAIDLNYVKAAAGAKLARPLDRISVD
jgi:hypothetical protein